MMNIGKRAAVTSPIKGRFIATNTKSRSLGKLAVPTRREESVKGVKTAVGRAPAMAPWVR